jgi:predicted deacylase
LDVTAAFTYNGGAVDIGETANVRFTVSETYLGDPVRVPVTIINGEREGPTLCLTAAAHGDELNGIEIVREVAHEWDHSDLRGTLVCLPVLNVPGFIAQQRYLPIYDRDLNRSFPGHPDGTSSRRIADRVFRNFIEPCDLGLDFHTSTRGRSNMLHVRADTDDPAVGRVAYAFGSNVVIDSEGPDGSLRREASEAGTPTVTVELGEAHRFQRPLIDAALEGVLSVMAEFGMHDAGTVKWPGWRTVVEGSDEKTWLRADAGGLVDMHYDRGSLVEAGETVCTISDPFKADVTAIEAPFTGLLIGVPQNPLVYPGNPLCHLVALEGATLRAFRRARSGTAARTAAGETPDQPT